MAVTTTYLISPAETYLDLIEGPGQSQVDIVALANGGLAATSTNGGMTDLDIFNPNGSDGGGFLNFKGTLSAVDQVANGNIVLVTDDGKGTLNYSIRDGKGGAVIGETFFALNARDPDVAGVSDGNHIFAMATQDNIRIGIPQGPGVQTIFTLDSGAADERPSIAALDGGGFAVAWSATRAGLTEVWYAVYEDSGKSRLAATLLETTGTVFHDVSVTSMAGGGFAIAYEDEADAGPNSDIRLVTFGGNGAVGSRVNISDPGKNDPDNGEIQPYVTRLDNDLLAVGYTRDYVGMINGRVEPGRSSSGFQDDDTLFRIYDPSLGVVSEAALIDVGQNPRNQVQDSALAGFGIGRVAAFHTDVTRNDAEGEVFNLVRRSVGDAAADVIKGDGMVDDMRGGGGNDTYYVRNAGDRIVEAASGGAADRVIASVDFALTSGVHVETLTTNSSTATVSIDLIGNALSQEIIGNYGANLLNSGGVGGADLLRGLSGNDIYRVHNADDTIIESAAQGAIDRVVTSVSYVLDAGVHIEELQTSSGAGKSAINLAGNEIAQAIVGNAGANRLEGKGGADTLRGLSGADTFVFATKLGGGNIDRILDFSPAADRFLLSDAIFTALTPGTIASAQFRANKTGLAQDASDRIIYDTDGGGIFYDSDGLGGASGVRFATVGLNLAITFDDFDVA